MKIQFLHIFFCALHTVLLVAKLFRDRHLFFLVKKCQTEPAKRSTTTCSIKNIIYYINYYSFPSMAVSLVLLGQLQPRQYNMYLILESFTEKSIREVQAVFVEKNSILDS